MHYRRREGKQTPMQGKEAGIAFRESRGWTCPYDVLRAFVLILEINHLTITIYLETWPLRCL